MAEVLLPRKCFCSRRSSSNVTLEIIGSVPAFSFSHGGPFWGRTGEQGGVQGLRSTRGGTEATSQRQVVGVPAAGGLSDQGELGAGRQTNAVGDLSAAFWGGQAADHLQGAPGAVDPDRRGPARVAGVGLDLEARPTFESPPFRANFGEPSLLCQVPGRLGQGAV